MKKIKPGLVVLLIVLGLFVGIFLGVLIMKSSSSSKYKVRVGHLSIPDSLNQNMEVFLDFYKGSYHTYSSAAPEIYNGNKYQFRKRVVTKFNALNHIDSGYLTFRFLINSQGEVFLHETIEMDLNLALSDLNDEMVKDLKKISFKTENWHPYIDSHHNYYMYLTYRIENGKITEFTP